MTVISKVVAKYMKRTNVCGINSFVESKAKYSYTAFKKFLFNGTGLRIS